MANKAVISLLLVLFAVASGLAVVNIAVWLVNYGGTIGLILAPVQAVIFGWVVFKVCGLVCKTFFHKKGIK